MLKWAFSRNRGFLTQSRKVHGRLIDGSRSKGPFKVVVSKFVCFSSRLQLPATRISSGPHKKMSVPIRVYSLYSGFYIKILCPCRHYLLSVKCINTSRLRSGLFCISVSIWVSLVLTTSPDSLTLCLWVRSLSLICRSCQWWVWSRLV